MRGWIKLAAVAAAVFLVFGGMGVFGAMKYLQSVPNYYPPGPMPGEVDTWKQPSPKDYGPLSNLVFDSPQPWQVSENIRIHKTQ